MRALVAGMHRSGTSALMRSLDALGIELGRSDRMMDASPSNPYGHFELVPIVALNDELLASVGSHWAAPAHSADQMAGLATLGAKTDVASLLSGLDLSDNSIVKDPRFSLTLPFWRAAGLGQIPIILPFRHPRSVAESLQRRNDLDPEYSYALWEWYHLALFGAAAGHAVFPVSYHSLVNDTRACIDDLVGWLGIDAGEALRQQAVEAIDASVANTLYAPDEVSGLPRSTQQLWELLQDLQPGPITDPTLIFDAEPSPLFVGAAQGTRLTQGQLALVESERDEARAELARAIYRLEGERDQARAEMASLVGAAEGERDQARAEMASLVGAAEGERDQARVDLVDTTARLEQERDDARQAFTNATDRLRKATEEAAASTAAHDATVHERDQIAAEHAGLTAHVQAVEGERNHFAGEAARYRHEAETVRTSRAGALVYRWWELRNRLNDVVAMPRQLAQRVQAVRPNSVRPTPGLIELPTTAITENQPEPLPEPVHFPLQEAPAVSIVVPVYGQLEFTAQCLRSILDTPTEWSYEVIVVDDVSPDRTSEWLKRCSGLNVVTNEVNLGFLRSTNAGATKARGSMLVLLNNDTTVHPGWLDELVELMNSADDIGAVGAKLVYPNGVLQEAGTIIWSDGQGWNWGRGLDPAHYEFNFVREVDYCSAACLLVRRDLWDQLGGFDERYVPAYYEDSDLAFSLRELGFRTLYQPAAVVTHFEGISHGTDETSGLKAHQITNRDRFKQKWAAVLKHHHPSTSDPRLASWRGEGQRIVIFDHEVPAWDQDSGSVRITAVLDLLVEMGFRVTFVPHNRYQREPYASQLAARGIEVFYGHDDWHGLLASLAPDLAAVIISRPHVATDALPVVTSAAPDTTIMYDMVDFHGLRIERRGELGDADELRHSRAIAEIEMAMVRSTDMTIAVTDIEADLVREKQPDASVVVVPNIHRSQRSAASFEERHGVMFIGAWRHLPNRDAIEFLCSEIMPLVWKQAPDITVDLVGSDIPADMFADIDPRIIVQGWVPDLDPLFEQVRCTIAPLRFGAGLKGKVGDSLMRGVPVVTTAIGAEGFGDVADAVLVAESAQELANELVRLHNDAKLWTDVADRGYAGIEEHFGYEAARTALTTALQRADITIPRYESSISP